MAQTYTQPEEWTLSPEGATSLLARTPNGAIRLSGSPGDQIEVSAVKKVRAAGEAAANAFLAEMRIERRRDGDRWIVEAAWPEQRSREVESAEVAFEIRAPRAMLLEAQSRNGALTATSVEAVRLDTRNGEIQARDIERRLEARTKNGAIRVEGCAGSIDVESANGRLELRGLQQPARATTRNGPVAAEVDPGCEAPDVELTTSNGAIDLRLPAQVSARLEAQTRLGRITLEPSDRGIQPSRNRLEAVLGEGAGAVKLRTANGAVRIRLGAGTDRQLSPGESEREPNDHRL